MSTAAEISLQSLFGAIAQTQSESDLKQSLMAALGEYFAARRWMLSFSNELPTIDQNTPRLMRLALSLDYNPVLRYLVKRHAAVHDEVVLPPGVWQTLCPRADHGHVMAGPLVSQGQLVGGVAFTRHRNDGAFNADDLADLGSLCLHLSTKLVALRAKPEIVELTRSSITPREAEIVDLVAQGLTNKQIGAALWITENSVKQALKRIFRKLGVSSRAEMVAKLSA